MRRSIRVPRRDMIARDRLRDWRHRMVMKISSSNNNHRIRMSITLMANNRNHRIHRTPSRECTVSLARRPNNNNSMPAMRHLNSSRLINMVGVLHMDRRSMGPIPTRRRPRRHNTEPERGIMAVAADRGGISPPKGSVDGDGKDDCT